MSRKCGVLPASEVYCFAGQHRQDIDQGGANWHALLTLYASTCKSSSKLRQTEQERDYALSHQNKVEIPVEKPVLYQKCQNCNQTAYLRAKEKYDMQREKLSGRYKAKTVMYEALMFLLI